MVKVVRITNAVLLQTTYQAEGTDVCMIMECQVHTECRMPWMQVLFSHLWVAVLDAESAWVVLRSLIEQLHTVPLCSDG